jgi:hypothetical protein
MDLTTIILVISILLIHYVGDFAFQTHYQAINKSKNNIALTYHVLTYSLLWAAVSFMYGILTHNYNILLFAPITFICHWITDYFTSRLNTKLWEAGNPHNFFVSVGADQMYHYIQLFLTYYLLTR